MNTVRWLGHAAFHITTSKGKGILIDPWISNNPSCPIQLEELGNVDLVLITHDHFDHLGDIKEFSGVTTIGQPELLKYLQKEYHLKEDSCIKMNTGGSVEIHGINITMVQAFHSSTHGSPTGFIIRLEDKKTIYHAGDTGIFSSMELLGTLYPLDLALLPIGGHFTMDPLQAAKAVHLLKPKAVLPMHYKTFPVLVQDADTFKVLVHQGSPGVSIYPLEAGGSCEI